MSQARSFFSCIILLIFTLSPSYAEVSNKSQDIQYISENGISWRVYNPFRLFNRPDDLNKYIKYADKGLKEQYKDIDHHITSKTENHPIFHLRYNSEKRIYDKDLLYYKHFKINAYKENGQASETCDWFVAGKKQISANCDNIVTLKIPYHQWNNPNEYLPSTVIEQSKISVTSSNNHKLTATIKAKHKLIISMGDSFASGQGNPDIPSVPSFNNPNKRFSKARHIRNVTYDRQASWFDDLCNRSLWSGHSLAAMKMAKNSPDTIISFVSTACTGQILLMACYLDNRNQLMIAPNIHNLMSSQTY